MHLVVLLIPLVHHRTAGISRIAMIAGGGDERARDQRGLVHDWGPPVVGLDWGGCREQGLSTVASDAAGAVVVAAAKIVTPAVVSSDHSRKPLPVSALPGNAHAASWQIHPSCTAASGQGSCAGWHGYASMMTVQPLSLLDHD